MAKDCFDRALESLGLVGDKALPDAVLEKTRGKLKSLVAFLDEKRKDPGTPFSESASDSLVRQHLEKAIEQLRIEAKIAAANRYRNLKARMRIADRIASVWKDNPSEGLKALMYGSLFDRVGSRNALGVRVAARQKLEVARFQNRMEAAGLLDIAGSRENTREIFRALRLISEKGDLSKISPKVRETALVIREFQQKMLVEANENGAWRGENDTFVFSRHHDQDAIYHAAGMGASSVENQKAWVDWMMESLDFDKSFPFMPTKERRDALSRAHAAHASGEHVYSKALADAPGAKMDLVLGEANVASKLSRTRVYHFKNADLDYEYHSRWGGDLTAAEVMMQAISFHARDVEILRVMGPNARQNFQTLVEELQRYAGKQPGGGPEILKIASEADWINRYIWPQLTGENGLRKYDADRWLGRVFQWLPVVGPSAARAIRQGRGWDGFSLMLDAALLGGAGVSTFSDGPAFGNTLARYSSRSAKRLNAVVRGNAEHLRNFAEAFTVDMWRDYGPTSSKVFPLARKHLLADLAVYVGHSADPSGRTGAGPELLAHPGWATRAMQSFLKLTRLTTVSDKDKASITTMIAGGLGTRKDIPFDKLTGIDQGYQDFLRQADISSEEWDFLRGEALQKDLFTGQEYLTVRTAENIPDAVMMGHPVVSEFQRSLLAQNEKYVAQLKADKEKFIRRRNDNEDKVSQKLKSAEATLEKRKTASVGKQDRVLDRVEKSFELIRAQKEHLEALTGLHAFLDQEDARLGIDDVIDEVLYDADVAPSAESVSPFRKAYEELDEKGRGYVPIHKLREKIGVPAEEFDKQLAALRRSKDVELEVGTPSDYTREQVDNSLMVDGSLYLSVSWIGDVKKSEGARVPLTKGPRRKAYRELREQGRSQATKGQRLGASRERTSARVKALTQQLDDVVKATTAHIRKTDTDFLARVQFILDSHSKWVATAETRIEAKEARLKEFQSRIGDRVIKEAHRVRSDMASRIAGMFNVVAGMATNEPDVRTRPWASGAVLAGGPPNAFTRMLMKYKGFVASLTSNHILGGLRGYDPNGAIGKEGLVATAAFLAQAVMSGMALWTLQEMIKGNSPPLPTGEKGVWKYLLRSAAAAGALGAIGDAAFVDTSGYGRSFTTSMAGPAIGFADDVHSAFSSVFQEADAKGAAKKIAKLTARNLPGQNLWMTRWAFDGLLKHSLEEYFSPGAGKKRARAMWESTRQVSVWNRQER